MMSGYGLLFNVWDVTCSRHLGIWLHLSSRVAKKLTLDSDHQSMHHSDCDITGYAWLDHASVGYPSSHLYSLELFKERVVEPSLRTLDAEITELQKSSDPAADFLSDDYGELYQVTIEGYLIALQSMWERGLRAMLNLREKSVTKNPLSSTLERATWGGNSPNLQDHFHRLMGVPVQAFDSYPDLDFLQNLGSAIRHGDGAAARKVHRSCPRLWFNWLPPGEEIVAGPFRINIPADGPKHPSFNAITLPEAVLGQMFQSAMWFWEDIECMRCNSFKQRDSTVDTKISNWRLSRIHRHNARIWHHVDGAFPHNQSTRILDP